MTPAQFTCCVSARRSAQVDAARLVLVDGVSVADAAAHAGITEQAVRNTMSRIRKADAQIRAAYCG